MNPDRCTSYLGDDVKHASRMANVWVSKNCAGVGEHGWHFWCDGCPPKTVKRIVLALQRFLDGGLTLNAAENETQVQLRVTRYAVVQASVWLEGKVRPDDMRLRGRYGSSRMAEARQLKRPIPTRARSIAREAVRENPDLASTIALIRSRVEQMREAFPLLDITEDNAIRSLLLKGAQAVEEEAARNRKPLRRKR